MAKIVHSTSYDGADAKVERLGLHPLLSELQELLKSVALRVKEERDANGGAAVRKLIDQKFASAGGWEKAVTGNIDWRKCKRINGTQVCIGVEVQVSGRSDLVAVDLIHLTNAIVNGEIDIGVIVVPSDHLGKFLTDRGPNLSETQRHLKAMRVEHVPMIVLAIEHDGPGPPLAKQAKRG